MNDAIHPSGREVRQVIAAGWVAERAQVPAQIARAIVDAHLFGVVALAASGVPIQIADSFWSAHDCPFTHELSKLFVSEAWDGFDQHAGDLHSFARTIFPPEVPEPRYAPIFERQLGILDGQLAVHLVGAIDQKVVDRVISEWIALVADAIVQGRLNNAVLKRSWERDEAGFESWMVEERPRLLGAEWELVKRQWRAPDGTRADLICRAITMSDECDVEAGDIIVLENKALEVTSSDIDQVRRYVQHIAQSDLVGDGQGVHAVVAGSGVGYRADLRADDEHVDAVTWAELGYSDYIWQGHNRTSPIRDFLTGDRR